MAIELPQTDDYLSLFLNDAPLLDVRAPIEFSQGAFPTAENFPLINDLEREQIGVRYKDLGQDEAIALGHQLVQGETKTARVDNWQQFFNQHPEGILYCFRGGMRSKISQQWIYERTGKIYPRVKGGYKAMRRFLLDQLDASCEAIQPVMLGGRTGIGKTLLLDQLDRCIDLEGLFHHRGSVFGKHVTPQPAQIDIENQLSIEFIKHRQQQHAHLLLEDEGANIGSRRIPDILFNTMKQVPLVLLTASIEERVDITFDEYINDALTEHQQHYGEQHGFTIWAEQLNTCFDKIQRRLGGVRYATFKKLLNNALVLHQQQNDRSLHRQWIEHLLVDYYDPMYDFQLSKKEHRVVFKGNRDDVKQFILENYQID